MALSLHLQLKELKLDEDFTGPLSAEILLHTPHNRGTVVVGTTERQRAAGRTVRWSTDTRILVDPDIIQEVIVRVLSHSERRKEMEVVGQVRVYVSAFYTSHLLERDVVHHTSLSAKGVLMMKCEEESPLPTSLSARRMLSFSVFIKDIPTTSPATDTTTSRYYLSLAKRGRNSAWQRWWHSAVVSAYITGRMIDFGDVTVALLQYKELADYREPLRLSLWRTGLKEADEGEEQAYVITTLQDMLSEPVRVFALTLLHFKNREVPLVMSAPLLTPLGSPFTSSPSQRATRMSLSCVIAIDFTKSNGPRHSASSRHHLHRGAKRRNPYQQSLHFLHDVLRECSEEENEVVYRVCGFGAVFDYRQWKQRQRQLAAAPPRPRYSSDEDEDERPEPLPQFPLHSAKQRLTSAEDLCQVYEKILPRLTFAGPTLLAPLIRSIRTSLTSSPPSAYTVAAVVTDGVCSDVEQTLQEIALCTSLPLSLVFVGVGDGGSLDFFNLRQMETRHELFTDNAHVTLPRHPLHLFRHNLQFLALDDVTGNSALLRQKREEVLLKVEEQCVAWMQGYGPGL